MTHYTDRPEEKTEEDLFRSLESDRGSVAPFEAFWRCYPSRHPHSNPAKPARTKFEAAVKRGVDPALIIRGAEHYAAVVAQQGTEPRYVAQAQTWLGQERWSEYQEAPKPGAQGAPRRRGIAEVVFEALAPRGDQ